MVLVGADVAAMLDVDDVVRRPGGGLKGICMEEGVHGFIREVGSSFLGTAGPRVGAGAPSAPGPGPG
jgi:hypothetical protein